MNPGFIERSQILSSLERYFYNEQLPNRMALVSGIPGVGKTTLLEHLERIMTRQDIPFAFAGKETQSAIQMMDEFAASFERKGYKLKGFRKKYNKYLETIAKIEKKSDMRDLGGLFLSKLAGKSIVQAGSLIPGGSLVVNTLGSEFIEGQTDALFNYLFSKLRVREDVALLLEPLSALSPLFVADLDAIGKVGNLVLALDNFDSEDGTVLSWISDIARGNYGDVKCRIIFVLAAQKFNRQLMVKIGVPLEEFVIEPFNLEETRSYYLSRGSSNPDLIPYLYEKSGGLPLFLAIFTSFKDLTVADVSQTIATSLLSSIDDAGQKAVLLRLSTALSFNKDILASLLWEDGGDLSKTFDWVKGLPFVNFSEGNWKFESSIRWQLLSYLQYQSPKEYKASNSSLFNFYRERLSASPTFKDTPWMNYEEWWQDYLYSCYHMLCSDPAVGKVVIYREFPARFFNTIYNSYKLAEWAEMMVLASRDAGIDGEFYDFARSVKDEFREFNFFNRKSEYSSRTRFIFDVVSRNCDESVPSLLRAWMYASKEILLARTNTPEQLLNALTKAIEIEPGESQFYTLRSITYIKQEKFVEALSDLSTAISIKPEDMNNYYLHGLYSYHEEDLETAVADFTNIINATSAPLAFQFRAKVFKAQELYDEAIKDATRAMDHLVAGGENFPIELSGENDTLPNDIEEFLYHSVFSLKELLLTRGESYYHLSDYEKAGLDFEAVLRESPEESLAHYHLGMIAFSKNDFLEGSIRLETSIRSGLTKNNQITAHIIRGICLQETKQPSLAQAELNAAIELDPDNVEARHTRATILLEIGDPAAAMADSSHILASDPKDCQALLSRAKSLIVIKQGQRAMSDLNLIIDLVHKEHVDFELDSVYFERGKLFFGLKDYPSSTSDFRKTMDLNPNHAGGYFHLGAISLFSGNFDKAIDYFNRAEKNKFMDPMLFFMRGAAYQKKGANDQALMEYSNAINNHLETPEAYYHRACMYLTSGDLDSAMNDLNKTLELDPNHHEALAIRGINLYYKGEYESALRDLERAAARVEVNTTLLNGLGNCYLRLELYEQGKKTFDRSVQEFPDNAAGYRGLAAIHLKRKNIRECLEMLARCKALDVNEFIQTMNDPDFKNIMNDQQYLLLAAQAKAGTGRHKKRTRSKK